MSEVGKIQELALKANDNTYVVLKGEVDGEARYSFDRGSTWHPTMIEAYNAADAKDLLELVTEHNEESFEAFVVALVKEMQSLEPGETLKVSRSGEAFMVTKEVVALACRASDVMEIDLRREEQE